MRDLLPSSRTFKVWEYQVSHGQLLIRSPKAPASRSVPEQHSNLDLAFSGVDYMALPMLLHGIEIVRPTDDELQKLARIVGCSLAPESVIILFSDGQRFPVVANNLTVSENEWDIFESPIEFRSQFRSA